MSETLSQRSWEWIKAQPDFHSTELAKEMEVSLHQAQMVIDHLKQLGAVTTVNRKANPVVYAKVARAKPHLPGKNTTQSSATFEASENLAGDAVPRSVHHS